MADKVIDSLAANR